jgi:predicted deacylase
MQKIMPLLDTLPEIIQIEKLLSEFPGLARGQVLGHVGKPEKLFPIYQISVGSDDPTAPVLGLIGGVHGLERIGAQVVISLLSSVLRMQLWDESLKELLQKIRIIFIPTVNPWGIYNRRRSNAEGVDLMRNSPVIGDGQVPWLLGGQKISPKLPWYQGNELQVECKLVIEALKKETVNSRFAWTLDVHSGFGLQDQIWFPFAKSDTPFPDVAEVYRFKTFFESAHPYHFYKIEPQTYRTHGDLWDFAYSEIRSPERFFLPLTLELGSWIWVKKNPLQLFSRDGLFYPQKPHRHRRILRRHWTLFDFMIRMTNSWQNWAQLENQQKEKARTHAMELWYGK